MKHVRRVFSLTAFVVLCLVLFVGLDYSQVFAATLELSPSSGTYEAGQNVTVSVLLNTQDVPIDGVDIHYLNYNPEAVLIQDQDPATPGVQIKPGNLMPLTLANTVDTTKGQISFSQITTGGSKFSNHEPKVLASFTVHILKRAPIDLTFNFAPGNTRDANVAALGGKDVLASVVNGHYDVTPQATGSLQTLEIVIILVIAIVVILLLVKFTKKAV